MFNITLPQQARGVIIGAGIVVAASVYHLTKLGWRDIVVVEQGPLFETGGSTSHAPGLVFQLNPSKTMTGFARYTVELWSELELEGEPCAKSVGSLEVAWTQERLTDLKRKAGYGMSWGVEAHLLSADEARSRIPMLSDRILGALYVPSDIQTRATRPAEAMAREAERSGATFYSDVKVIGFTIADGRIAAVHTTCGDIKTDLVVAATGIWAPKVGRACRCAHPAVADATSLRRYDATAELAGATEDISQAFLRHQDEAMYFLQVGECYGIGSVPARPLLVDANDILDTRKRQSLQPKCRLPPPHFEKAMAAAGEVLPGLKGVGLTRKSTASFRYHRRVSRTRRSTPGARVWSAQAVWITHAGGVWQGGC